MQAPPVKSKIQNHLQRVKCKFIIKQGRNDNETFSYFAIVGNE